MSRLWENCIARFARRLQGLCRRLLHPAESAEDASSEVFVRVARMLTSYNGSVPFERWLFRALSGKNLCGRIFGTTCVTD
jgi:DNA-directed RNA polymerase specialized sigma24 family protein